MALTLDEPQSPQSELDLAKFATYCVKQGASDALVASLASWSSYRRGKDGGTVVLVDGRGKRHRSRAEAFASLSGGTPRKRAASGAAGAAKKPRATTPEKPPPPEAPPPEAPPPEAPPPEAPPPEAPAPPPPPEAPAPPPPPPAPPPPAPPTEATDEELAYAGRVFADEGVRWLVEEVYFDEDIGALCGSYYDFDARGFDAPADEGAVEVTPLAELLGFAAWVDGAAPLEGAARAAAAAAEARRRDARDAEAAADGARAYLAALLARRQPAWGAATPVAEVGDVDGCRRLLDVHGCVVFRGAASPAEVARAEDLFWAWLEGAAPGLARGDPATHTTARLGALGWANTGVLAGGAVGQSDFLWHLRLCPGVLACWRTVLGLRDDEPMVCSLDGCGALCGIQPLVWVVLTKLENSLARSHRSRFG